MYQGNDKFLMPWGKYQGKLTIAEMVKNHRKYAEAVVKPKEEILRIIQELETPTQINETTTDQPQQDDPMSWPGDSDRPF